MKEERDGWTERREKDEGTTEKWPGAAVEDNKGRKSEPHHCQPHRRCTMT